MQTTNVVKPSRLRSFLSTRSSNSSAIYLRQMRAAYFFLLPGLFIFLTLNIYPLLKALQISFYDWSIMPNQPSQFVGLENYLRAFKDPIVWLSFKNTLLYTVVTVPGQVALAMGAALLLNDLGRGKVFFRVIYYLPVITSWVIVSLLFRYMFQSPNGFINYLLVDVIHLVDQPIGWLRNASTAFIPILALGIWKGIGWSMVIFLAALQTIPNELYEASAMDGANGWHKFSKITLPLIRPTVVFVLVMLMIGGLNVFLPVALITNGGPMQKTEVVLSYMYHQAFDYLEFGYGSALSFMMAIFIVSLSFFQIRFFRRPEEMH
jgi:multiple sugar transport system permease protein